LQFDQLNLDPRILEPVKKSGFIKPTDIQQRAIPVVLSGADLMASAQTGTGKTAAFVLPALQRILRPSRKSGNGPRVLVLTPTRELAMQVNQNIRQFSRCSKVSTGSIIGGMAYGPQLRMLRGRLDLLVATPGRLLDHMEQGKVDFSRLEILVLDEADRMLDMGFIDAVKDIAAATPKDRQTLLFSATLEGRVLQVAKQLLKNPESIALAASNKRHKSIEQHMHHADSKAHKQKLLEHHLESGRLFKSLVFTATKRGAEQVAKVLRSKNLKSAALHGDMSQNKRRQTVENLRKGRIETLVATDVAARGLDIKDISHVINYDLPTVAEDYIHRIGRTGRASATGFAISLVGPADWKKLSQIEKLIGQKVKREIVDGLEPSSSEPRASSRAEQKPRPRRKFSKGAKSASTRKPGSWRKGQSGSKQSKSFRVKKAA
jgi:superfamily II DNA/RNA helicase|tara:strand:- start:1745 stop:3043 length:1299 start_codon:yes stop_codon:yes gene_type:complete